MDIFPPDIMTKFGAFSIYSHLLQQRQVYLTGDIDDMSSNSVIAQLHYLNSLNDSDIILYINSPGGDIYNGLGIIDAMRLSRSAIQTICVGMACSMAAIVLAAGTQSLRQATATSTIMIHQGYGGFEGKVTETKVLQKEADRIETLCNELMSEYTGKSLKQLVKDQQHDKYMNAKDALEYGIIDSII